MKHILDGLLDSMKHTDYNNLSELTSPTTLPNDDYLPAVLHIGIVEVDIQHNNKVLPMIGYLSTSCGSNDSWFVAVDQQRLEGELIVESANKLGFSRSDDGTWKFNDAIIMSEKDAIQAFIDNLVEKSKLSSSKSVILITPRYDVTLPILISALSYHNLLGQFLKIVKGFGDMELLSSSKKIQFKNGGLKPYEEYLKSTSITSLSNQSLDKPEERAIVLWMILEQFLSGKPNYDNFYRLYCRPTVSPYTIKLLFNSHILEVRDTYHRITIINKVC